MSFLVTRIIDSNTIEVTPFWKWGNDTGNFVKILGYGQPDLKNSNLTKAKLEILLLKKSIELKRPSKAYLDNGNNVIECYVYLNGIDVSEYFPELKQLA